MVGVVLGLMPGDKCSGVVVPEALKLERQMSLKFNFVLCSFFLSSL